MQEECYLTQMSTTTGEWDVIGMNTPVWNISVSYHTPESRDSSVDRATGYRLKGRGSIPGRGIRTGAKAARACSWRVISI
jgi:hypothetical protein